MSSPALSAFLKGSAARGEFREFSGSVHTVAEAAREAKVREDELIKTIILKVGEGAAVCVIPGHKRLDMGKIRSLVGEGRVRIAKPDEVLQITGYPVGGVPPVFSGADKMPFFIDSEVLTKPQAIGGGGDANSLLVIEPSEIIRLSGAKVSDLTQV